MINKQAAKQCIENRVNYVLRGWKVVSRETTLIELADLANKKIITRKGVLKKINGISMEFGFSVTNFDMSDSGLRFELEEV